MRVVKRTLGVSLIEVMTTLVLVVVAAGAMVRACAHVRSTASQAAAQQTAWQLAAELAEWLRLQGDRSLGKLPEDPASLIVASGTVSDCYHSACLPAQAAGFFLHDWYRRLRSRLPGFRVLVCYGTPPAPHPSDRDDASCARHRPSPGLVWFRLWKPQSLAGRDLFRGIALIVRRPQ